MNPLDHNNLPPIHAAANRGDFTMVVLLVEKGGVEVNETTAEENLVALHCAAEMGQLNIVIYLVDRGANTNALNNDKWTPLHMAAVNGHLDVGKCLLARGA